MSACGYSPKNHSHFDYFQIKTDTSNVNILNREMLSQTVKFQMDTDCRPNYVSDELFYAFKKQRDEFYSLLQEWEDTSQRRSSTEFFKSRHKRLRQIFTINTASTNMFRLANLFVSQIMASVFNENVVSRYSLTSNIFTWNLAKFLRPISPKVLKYSSKP